MDDQSKIIEQLCIRLEKRFDKIDQQLSILLSAVRGHAQRITLIENNNDLEEVQPNGTE